MVIKRTESIPFSAFFLKIRFIRKLEEKQIALHINVFPYFQMRSICFFFVFILRCNTNSNKFPKFQPNVIRIETTFNLGTYKFLEFYSKPHTFFNAKIESHIKVSKRKKSSCKQKEKKQ